MSEFRAIVNMTRDAALVRSHGYLYNAVQRNVADGIMLTRVDGSAVMRLNVLIADATPERGCVVGVRYTPVDAACRFQYEGADVGFRESGDGYRIGTVWNAGVNDGVAGCVEFDADEATVTGAFLMPPGITRRAPQPASTRSSPIRPCPSGSGGGLA